MSALPLVLQVPLAALVIVAGVYDILYRRIPNWLVLAGFLVGLALNAILGSTYSPGIAESGLGVGLAFLIYFPLYLLRGMGAGDVKLMAAVAALVGWKNWLIIFVFAGILGGVLAIIIILTKGRFRKTIYNVGYILWEMGHMRPPRLSSEELDVRSPKAVTLPHGAVIALACLFFLGGGLLLGR